MIEQRVRPSRRARCSFRIEDAMTVPLLPSLHPLVPGRGIRERAKAERRQRIKEAATATFREKGYANATTREIAGSREWRSSVSTQPRRSTSS
jgi:hypothetical protein